MHYFEALYCYFSKRPKKLLICEQISEDYCDMVPEVYPVTFKSAGEARDKALVKVFYEVFLKELAKVEKVLGNNKFLVSET